jgi:hypothetical protein
MLAATHATAGMSQPNLGQPTRQGQHAGKPDMICTALHRQPVMQQRAQDGYKSVDKAQICENVGWYVRNSRENRILVFFIAMLR